MKQLLRGLFLLLFCILTLGFFPHVVSRVYAATTTSISTNLSDYGGSVPQYKKFELTFTLNTTYTNPFNPDEAQIDGHFTSPTGKTLTQPAFYYQNYTVSGIGSSETYTKSGTPVWKIRFSPSEVGTYQYTISDKTGTITGASGSFAVSSSVDPGFIQVSTKNGRYFEYTNGTPFIGLGLDISWWQQENQRIGFYQYYLNRMNEYKANLARVWMTNSGINQTWIMSVQDKILGADYNLEEAWAFDYILNQAELKNVKFLLTIDDVNQYGSNWGDNLYNSSNGGPCSYPACIFTNTTAKTNQRRLFRYLVARYGYSPSILSWEFFNEINEMEWITSNWNWQDAINWHQEMGQYVKSVDAHKHMTNTSTGSFKTFPELYNALPEMSFGQIHFYYVPGWQWAISDPAGQDMANLVRYYSFEVYSSVTNKPSIIGEWGLVNSGWTDNTTYLNSDDKGVHLHNGSWAALMSGMASTGLSWHWGYHKTHDTKWWQHYLALANYFAGIDVTNLTVLKPVNVTFTFPAPSGGSAPAPSPDNRAAAFTSTNSKLRAMGLKNTNNEYIWIQNSDNTWWNYVHGTAVSNQSGTVSVLGLVSNASYSVEWWDAYTGAITKTETLTANSNGTIGLPITNLSNDLAVKLIKSGSEVPTVTTVPFSHCLPLGDVNCSGKVDSNDVLSLLPIYGRLTPVPNQEDLDDSGKINMIDLSILLRNFGSVKP